MRLLHNEVVLYFWGKCMVGSVNEIFAGGSIV